MPPPLESTTLVEPAASPLGVEFRMLFPMSSSEREREQRIAAEAEPEIIEALGDGRELQEVAEEIAERYGLDEIKAYRWTSYIDERYRKRKNRIALIAVSIMWFGAIVLVVGVVALLFVASTILWGVIAGLGALIALPAVIIAFLSRKIAYRRGKGGPTFK